MKNQEIKSTKNWSLIIGLAIPLLMVMFIATSIYTPRLFDNTPAPTVNFLYTSAYSHPHRLEVRDNRLEWIKGETNNTQQNKAYERPPKIYFHDVKLNSSREIDLESAQKLLLDARNTSPEGYKVEQSRHHGFFIFDHRYSRDRYLVNKHANHKLALEYAGSSYYGFQFLGWVVE
jgi:hypothetical protein